MDSYVEEVQGLKDQDTYVVITPAKYEKSYQSIQIIPTMCVQTIKKDEVDAPDRAKSRIVAIGNLKDRIWQKSEKHAPVLHDESSRLMTSMAVGMSRQEKQGDCKNAFCQSYLPKDEAIIVRPPKGCPLSRRGGIWLLRKTLSGLRRSSFHWYQNIQSILLIMDLTQIPHDPCVFSGLLV
jgi:hypothetical protein